MGDQVKEDVVDEGVKAGVAEGVKVGVAEVDAVAVVMEEEEDVNHVMMGVIIVTKEEEMDEDTVEVLVVVVAAAAVVAMITARHPTWKILMISQHSRELPSSIELLLLIPREEMWSKMNHSYNLTT